MKKVLFAIIAIIILNVLPFCGNIKLLTNYKTIIIIIEGFLLWLTQPAFSMAETKENLQTDKFSILFILIASSISVVFAEIEWAYFSSQIYNTSSSLTIAGLALIVIGISLRIWAIISLGKHFTATVRVINHEHHLIQTGPYRIVRHPSYTGAFLAIIGVAFFLNSIISIFVSGILMFIAYLIRINKEEQLLITYFGDNYIRYAKNKKRLFPYIW